MNSDCSFFCGYMFGIKLVFGASAAPPAAPAGQLEAASAKGSSGNSAVGARGGGGDRSSKGGSAFSAAAAAAAELAGEAAAPSAGSAAAVFGVTPSVFASYPPGACGAIETVQRWGMCECGFVYPADHVSWVAPAFSCGCALAPTRRARALLLLLVPFPLHTLPRIMRSSGEEALLRLLLVPVSSLLF